MGPFLHPRIIMKNIKSVLVLLALTIGSSAMAGVNASSIQKSQCFPEGSVGQNWPVRAIYLHGLFPPSGTGGNYINWEIQNRKYLQNLALRHHIRIAVPTSNTVIRSQSYGTVRTWSNKSLKQIESVASAACGGAKLDKPRAMIGFSNGGYKATAIAAQGCTARGNYSVIMAIGSPKANASSCRGSKFVKTSEHLFPPRKAENYFDDNLATVSRASSSNSYSSPSPNGGSVHGQN